MIDIPKRPRRNRKSKAVRDMVRETTLHPGQLIFPLFIIDGSGQKIPINSMPGMTRMTVDHLLFEIEACMKLDVNTFCLFPAFDDELKDKEATLSYDPDNFYLRAFREVKARFPEACLMTDVAMDPYSSDGHDGLVVEGKILNDETLVILGKMAVAQAEAGADIIGPSDMMDGRVGYIRSCLDEAGHTEVSIMSYTAKYASAFYGPFREALDSAPRGGDKKTYQMDPANGQEAILEALLDEEEGADFLMVKPALSYLDVIHRLKETTLLPISAYNVSGEYAMIKAAGEKGWLDAKAIRDEVLLSIRRAGADVILTYFAKEFAQDYKDRS